MAYPYDDDGRLESELRTIDDMVFETQYGYDDAGNLRTLICQSVKRREKIVKEKGFKLMG